MLMFVRALLACAALSTLGCVRCSGFGAPVQSSQADVLDVTNIPRDEYTALEELYTVAKGTGWHWGPGTRWNFTGYNNPCVEEWSGIKCTSGVVDGNVHVEMLLLPQYNLRGYIPSSIGNLTYLQNLTLSFNLLSGGGIPESIGKLTQLQRLIVGSSRLTGTIPASLGQLTQLRTFDVSYNALNGSIPTTLCDLTLLDGFYLNSNSITGPLFDCIGSFTDLVELYVDTNFLNSTLPSSLGNLHSLTALSTSYNNLYGTLPTTYAALTQLQYFSMSNNAFIGALPAYLGTYTMLAELDVNTNMFTGTIPRALSGLVSLEILHLSSNYLNGTIPTELSLLIDLYDISLSYNQLTGELLAVCNFTNAMFLSLSGNYLSGEFPACMGNLTKLEELDFAENALHGTLPATIGIWDDIAVLIGSHNHFSGSIPAGMFALPNVNILDFSGNRLSGALPGQDVTGHSLLTFMNFALNQLSGTIPPALGQYRDLIYVNLSSNHLVGSIPSAMVDLHSLNFLYLNDNALSGELPLGWENLQALSYLFLDSNFLRGQIPSTFAQLRSLISLNLSSNHLTGTIPAALSSLDELQVLLLQDNALTGTLGELFNATAGGSFSSLVTFQVSHNELTGTLPEAMFLLDSLRVLAMVSNCFTGSLPLSICNSTTINTLALDGLQSAPSCHRALFPSSLNGIVARSLYSIASPLTGGVPACLFQMGNLTTLHLSGNGLTGTLPSSDSGADYSYFTPSLTDLSLSHNKLSGSIPSALLGRRWTNLDLSYNRFTRGLQLNNSISFPADASIALEQNRLSGKIPTPLVKIQDISVLESNLFACNAQRSNLPSDDPYQDKYMCGSDTLNASVYAWLAIMFALLVVLVVVVWYYRRAAESVVKTAAVQVRAWWDASSLTGSYQDLSPVLFNFAQVVAAAEVLVRVSCVCAAWIVFVLMPVYIACSKLYGTYSHQYAWTLSGAYLSGTTSFALEFVFLTLLVILAFVSFTWLLSVSRRALPRIVSTPSVAVTQSPLMSRKTLRWFVQAAFVALNFTVVLGVNIAYVVIALNKNGNALTFAQFALALFKVGFNSLCSPFLMRWISHRVLGEGKSRDFVSIQLVVTLVNNILIPCFVVAVVSPSCFYNIFKVADNVVSTYTYNGKCVSFDQHARQVVTCQEQQVLTATTSYDPPFTYSYQCSSSFITYYAPAYVIMCILAGFAIPVMQVVLKVLHASATPDTRWFALLDKALPRILRPIKEDSSAPRRDVFSPFFDAGQHLTTLLTHLGLMLTFGALFPPLAICFLVTILSATVFTRLKVGRFVHLAREQNQIGYVRIINEECEGAGVKTRLRRAVFTVLVFSCIFYTLFLFDTLGDAVGFGSAYWVIFVVPLIPVCLVPVYVYSRNTPIGSGKEEPSFPRDSKVEMMGMPSESSAANPIHDI